MRLLPPYYAIRNLGRSPGRLLATVGGVALVVLMAIAATAFVQGMRRSLSVSPGNRNVLLLGAGSEESVERSQIGASVPTEVRTAVRGIRERLDEPFVSPEVHLALIVSRPGRTEDLRAMVRGVTPGAFLVHSRVQLYQGRAPLPGRQELLAGDLAARKLGIPDADLAVGRTLRFEGRDWSIVGRFRAPGTVMNAELWAHLGDLQLAAKRTTLSCVVVTLDEAELDDLEAWTRIRLDLELTALSEAAYYDSLNRFYRPIRAVIWTTAVLISLAGVFGGLNTMYAAFAARGRELGMLQSLGFGRTAILTSLVQESLLAAMAGVIGGCLLGLALVHGRAVPFSMGVFELRLDALCIFTGVGAGLLTGLVGALPPALHCLRQPIAAALRSG